MFQMSLPRTISTARRGLVNAQLAQLRHSPGALWDREIHQGRKPSPALVTRTVDWVWMESGEAVREAVVRARMQERPFAEEALRELELNGWRSDFAEAVVWRLARRLADELPA